ncbi:hypothetical protein VTO42DRAFT_2969 [Malbranchea cinnamomea]
MTDRYLSVESELSRTSTSRDESQPISAPQTNVPDSQPDNGKEKKTAVKHTRPSSRVKFTMGGDSDSDSDLENAPLPDKVDDGTQFGIRIERPAASHSPSPSPSSRSWERLTEYSSTDDVTTPFPPLAEEGESSAAQALGYGGLRKSSLRRKGTALNSAYQRAQQLASRVRRPSFFSSQKKSDAEDDTSPIMQPPAIRMEMIDEKSSSPVDPNDIEQQRIRPRQRGVSGTFEAGQIVRQLTMRDPTTMNSPPDLGRPPMIEEEEIEQQLQDPAHYHVGVLGNLLKLYGSEQQRKEQQQQQQQPPPTPSPAASPRLSPSPGLTPVRPAHVRGTSYDSSTPYIGRTKPKWYSKTPTPNQSTTSLPGLLSSVKSSSKQTPSSQGATSDLKTSRSSGMLAKAAEKFRNKPRLEDEIRITVHIAAILSRQRYLTKLCEALMRYGAPTHRLEEYLTMTARVLEIDAQFLYVPGCMFVSFGDAATHTTDLRLLRYPQGVDLGKLKEVHEIYKEVVHDVIGVEEAITRLDEILARKPKFSKWWLIFLYGCASATVGPFAFGARPVDMPIAFFLGCLVGGLNHLLVPRSSLYANIFELSAALLTSFLSRAFGSIRSQSDPSQRVFCFAALAQSSIALILPGYIVLCSSLELQSRNLLAGSVRLVFAIIYSLVLGFGMMLGTSFYGSMDHNASSAATCPPSPGLNEYAQRFPFVILFTLCLILINQAKWKQAPMMLLTSFAGYLVNYFSSKHFAFNTQIANALGAFCIGVIGNLYSRIHHGLAAAAMLPAIFVQVPSGLAATGSLKAGLTYANQMNKSNSDIGASNSASAAVDVNSSKVYGNVVFELGYGMVQVSLAITVGLFLAALVVYPLGKRRSGLFSF